MDDGIADGSHARRHTDIGRDSIASETTTVLPTVSCTIIAIEDSWKANCLKKASDVWAGFVLMHFLRPTVQSGYSQVPGTATYRLNQGGRAALTAGTKPSPTRTEYRSLSVCSSSSGMSARC